MENKKIEKNKSYTYEELKEIFEEAMTKTVHTPTGEIDDKELKKESEDPHLQFQLMLSAMIILHTMEDNLFEKDNEKENNN